MIKIIIGFIAFIFIGFMAYLYTGNNSPKVIKPITEKRVDKKVISKENYKTTISIVKEVVPKKTTNKDIAESDLFINKKLPKNNKNTIGIGLTLEEIENSNVSEEKKEILFSDLAYRKSLNVNLKPMSEKEALELIKQDVKNGIL